MDPKGSGGYIYINTYIYILLDMADIPKKSIFGLIWQLGWFGMVQKTPMGCGNDLPILLRNVFFVDFGNIG